MFDIPASNDGKNIPTVILQCHVDMVCVSVDDKVNEDFEIVLEESKAADGKPIIHSKDNKTTIGADNGVGIATLFALAKNRDKFKHGKIRCILTTDEENGFYGASQVPTGKEKDTKD